MNNYLIVVLEKKKIYIIKTTWTRPPPTHTHKSKQRIHELLLWWKDELTEPCTMVRTRKYI